MKKSLIKISILAALSLISHANDEDHAKNMTMSRDLFRNEIKKSPNCVNKEINIDQ